MMNYFFKYHFEWVFLLTGLIALALMDPYLNNGPSLCLFDVLGFEFCPGDGLGHSISLTFRGDVTGAIESHPAGPAAILIMSGRILHLLKKAYQPIKTKLG